MTVAADAEQDAVRKAMEEDNVQSFVNGKTVRKVIYVPGKLLNIVATKQELTSTAGPIITKRVANQASFLLYTGCLSVVFALDFRLIKSANTLACKALFQTVFKEHTHALLAAATYGIQHQHRHTHAVCQLAASNA